MTSIDIETIKDILEGMTNTYSKQNSKGKSKGEKTEKKEKTEKRGEKKQKTRNSIFSSKDMTPDQISGLLSDITTKKGDQLKNKGKKDDKSDNNGYDSVDNYDEKKGKKDGKQKGSKDKFKAKEKKESSNSQESSVNEKKQKKSGDRGRQKRQAKRTEALNKMTPENLSYLLSTFLLKENKLSRCFVQILWEDQIADDGVCSQIYDALGQDLQQFLLKVLKKELSPAFFSLDIMKYVNDAEKSGFINNITKSIITKTLLPISSSDLKGILQPIFAYTKDLKASEKNENAKIILGLIDNNFKNFLLKNKNLKELAQIIRGVQKALLLRYTNLHIYQYFD